MLGDFLRGFYYFLTGFKLIREPSLVRFVWVPLCCNAFLFLLMLVFAAYGLNIFSQWVQSFLPHWLSWLRWIVWILSVIFSGIGLVFLSTILVNLIAGPFNSILSEKVIQNLNLQDKIAEVSFFKALPNSIIRQLHFILYYLPRAIFYLILFIIPMVQIFAAIIWFLFNGWVFTMQYLDYPMENHGVSIKEMRAMMTKRRSMSLGFGCGVVLFAMIPLINFVIVPVAVVGATVMWAREYKVKVLIPEQRMFVSG